MKKIFALIFALCMFICSCSTPEMEKAEAIKAEVLSSCIADIRNDLIRPQTLTVSEILTEIICEIDDPIIITKSSETYWKIYDISKSSAKEYLDENISDLNILKANGYKFYIASVNYYARNGFDDERNNWEYFIATVKLDNNGNIEYGNNLPYEISSKLHNPYNTLTTADKFYNMDIGVHDVVEQYGLDLNFPNRVNKKFTIPKEYRR